MMELVLWVNGYGANVTLGELEEREPAEIYALYDKRNRMLEKAFPRK